MDMREDRPGQGGVLPESLEQIRGTQANALFERQEPGESVGGARQPTSGRSGKRGRG